MGPISSWSTGLLSLMMTAALCRPCHCRLAAGRGTVSEALVEEAIYSLVTSDLNTLCCVAPAVVGLQAHKAAVSNIT